MRVLTAISVFVGLTLAMQASAADGSAVNGRAVSVQWRYGWVNWGPACCECYERQWKGSINLFTITSGRVSRTDTIYNRTQGCAESPAFNLAGTKVAFYRSSKAPSPTERAPVPSCVSGGPNTGRISVIDIDGSNLTDLCNLGADIPSEGGLDWPVGNWIYYVQTRSGAVGGGPDNNEIWRVNAVTKENAKVMALTGGTGDMSCTYFRRFQLNAAGNRMGIQVMPMTNCENSFDANGIADFPAPGGTLGSAHYVGLCGCNAAVSASGGYAAHWCGGHNDLFIVNGLTGAGITHANLDQVAQWSGQGDKFGRDAELVRWAANSDKWVLQQVGWYGHAADISLGSNQVAANWTDQAAIAISSNPKIPLDPTQSGTLYYGNCAGDMWVADPVNNPSGNKYEDLQGAWHTVDATAASPERAPAHLRQKSGSAVALDAASRAVVIAAPDGEYAQATITDLRGVIVARTAGPGAQRVSLKGVASGTYLVSVEGAGASAIVVR